ncbi:MAG: acyltransferase [Candidatus Lindowbacteria bacterium]|nr:acyltransferase [Candidatus Lindowbacteria bacterium]
MLYTKEYIAKALKGDYAYGAVVALNPAENLLASAIQAGMSVCVLVIRLLAKIPGISDLLEIFVRNYPRGAAGFFLRGAYFSAKVGNMGKNVLIDLGVTIWNPKNLSIGDFSHIDTNVKIEASDAVTIGSYVHIASNVLLQGRGTLAIEDYADIAAGSLIYSGVNHYTDGQTNRYYEMSSCAPADKQFVRYAPVRIGKSAFVGLNSVVMPGVSIGEGAIVGACSFVNSDIPPYKIAVGAPAKVLKDRPH